jgi:hypothetical protein
VGEGAFLSDAPELFVAVLEDEAHLVEHPVPRQLRERNHRLLLLLGCRVRRRVGVGLLLWGVQQALKERLGKWATQRYGLRKR